jgi:hypothetical protein
VPDWVPIRWHLKAGWHLSPRRTTEDKEDSGTLISLVGTSLASATIEARGLMHSPRSSVVAIIGDARQAEMFDALLPETHDYVIFVESIARGYSRIKELRPNLVIVFATIDDPGACQLLSMLTTDRDVMGIPVVTSMTWRGIDEVDAAIDEIDSYVSSAAIAAQMN